MPISSCLMLFLKIFNLLVFPHSTAGTTWSTDSSSRTSSMLVLRNLTPQVNRRTIGNFAFQVRRRFFTECFVFQIDGSTLRTLCMQHGPLITFHLNLTQGSAVVRYSSKDEAAKAQKSLHMYVSRSKSLTGDRCGLY